ncbi:MAG: PorP/SprF family type IX secretion system membrane protein [Bacteroidales bacterium]
MRAILLNLLITIIVLPFIGKAQDANFTQFYNNPIYYNPANAGITDGLEIRTAYRKLWPGIGGGFRNMTLSADVAEPAINGGIGLIVHSGDEGGQVRESMAGLMYSYRLHLIRNKFYLQMGLQATAVEKRIHEDGLIFSDQLDPLHGNVYPTSFQGANYDQVVYPDFATGIAARFNIGEYATGHARTTHIVGLAFAHITQPDESFVGLESRRPLKTVVHAQSVIPLNAHYRRNDPKRALAPGIIYERQDMFQTVSTGLNIMLEPIYAGAWYRSNYLVAENVNINAFVLLIGLTKELSPELKMNLGYSYDITTSKLSNATAGAHEITLSFSFNDYSFFRKYSPSLKRRNLGAKNCYWDFD